ncbi:uncharacterized protein LOC143040687 isoform X1 [Oratosquilla oratoria]|uniref:uncharacterized protein LOC143040687 isoform X1 n=1 Tax=Oratosquilla oratoria TaxID=337810 RepID=UPI003F77750A
MESAHKCHHLLLPLVLLLLLLPTAFVESAAPAGDMMVVGGFGVRSQRWWRDDRLDVEPTLAVTSRNVTAVAGHTASLPCRVHDLNDKTVSWIRTRDLTVLAVDRFTVTTDKRFSVVHPEETDDWLLEIRDVRPSDSATYDCQVNTHPKLSSKIHLRVLLHRDEVSIFDVPVSDSGVPSKLADDAATGPYDGAGGVQVQILGALQQTVKEEASLNLECVAEGKDIASAARGRSSEDPVVLWTLDDVPVDTLWKPWKVSASEEKRNSDRVVSRLTVRSVIGGDGGLYACTAPGAQPSIIHVEVVSSQGKSPLLPFFRPPFLS